MTNRAEATGDQRIISGKLAAKYDTDTENEVINWFKELLNEDLPRGMRDVEKALRSGVLLMKLAIEVQKRTPNAPAKAKKMHLKVNTMNAPFKQMENITTFVAFCENYGMDKTGTFQTVDLYDGRNMPQVLNCVSLLGTECQRHGMDGPTIGAKPCEKHKPHFDKAKLIEARNVIGMQAGSNKFDSQKGYKLGASRYCADIRADVMDMKGKGILSQQNCSIGDNQSGMVMGGVRYSADIKVENTVPESAGLVAQQLGSNQFASQKGMRIGAVRHASDIRADDQDKDGKTCLPKQMGTNEFASQKNYVFGGVRHGSDLKVEDYLKESSSIFSGQMGTNKLASQIGLSFGAVRHCADIKAIHELTAESASVIPLQSGTNRYASQTGMHFGTSRHCADRSITDEQDMAGRGLLTLQNGTNFYESQCGMSPIGGSRDLRGKTISYNLPDIDNLEV